MKIQILSNNQYAYGAEYADRGDFYIDEKTDEGKKILEGYKFDADFDNKTVVIHDELTDEGKNRKNKKQSDDAAIELFKLILSGDATADEYNQAVNLLIVDYLARNRVEVEMPEDIPADKPKNADELIEEISSKVKEKAKDKKAETDPKIK